jgi:hypothetical protein
VWQYIVIYFGITLPALVVGIVHIIKYKREWSWLIFYMVSIFVAIFLSGRVMASRYFYILVPITTVIITIGIETILKTKYSWKKLAVIGCWLLVFSQSLLMVMLPSNGIYASDDRNYLFRGDVSTFGLEKVADHIKDKAGESIVGVYGTWGIPEGAIVLLEEKGIEAVSLKNILSERSYLSSNNCDPDREDIGGKCWKVEFDNNKTRYVYIVGKYDKIGIMERLKNIELVEKFERPGGENPTYLYKIK